MFYKQTKPETIARNKEENKKLEMYFIFTYYNNII